MAAPRMKEIAVDWYGATQITSVQKQEKGFLIRTKSGNKSRTLTVSFPAVGGVRVADGCGFFEYSEALPITYSGKKYLRMAAGDSAAVFRRDAEHGFVLDIENAAGKKVLTLKGSDLEIGFTGNKIKKIEKTKFSASFDAEEVLYGLGERYNRFNQVGCRAYLWNMDTGFCKDTCESYQNIPLLHSSAGYTLFFNNTYGGWADFGVEKVGIYSFDYSGPVFDLFIFTGTPLHNLDLYTQVTGRPILPPKWAYQYWMGAWGGAWKYQGKSFAENLRRYLDGYAEMGIKHVAACYGESGPCTDEECYEMLKESGCRMLFWNCPEMSQGCGLRVEGDNVDREGLSDHEYAIRAGKMILGSDAVEDQPYAKMKKNGKWIIPSRWFDFTHPNIYKMMHGRFRRYFKLGLKGSMLDFGEYIDADWKFHNGEYGQTAHNQHVYWYGKVMSEVFREYCGDDHVLFQRSGCAGSQHWAVHFGGDQVAVTNGLNQALNALVTSAASGIPTWGSDVGGLYGTPSPDVYIRWVQCGAFSPLMRAHSGDGPGNNPWCYGDQAKEVFSRMYWWRENMLPYIYSHAVNAHKNGAPIVYPMAMMYPDDKLLVHTENQYLFGTELLVAPVTVERQNWRWVRFPAGNWVNLWTGETVEGGRELSVKAPLDTIPVYVREGAVMVLTVPADTLATCETLEDVQLTTALMVTPASEKRVFAHGVDADTVYRFVSDKVGDEAVTVDNVDDMEIGGLIVNGLEAKKVVIDGKEVAFTVENRRTLVKLQKNFKQAKFW